MTNLGNKDIFAKNLCRYIERSGKTKKDIADIIGVAPSTLNEWTKGKKYPRMDKIEMLANYFKCLKSDLIEEKTEEMIKMQDTNSTITDIIIKMRSDNDFLSLVEMLYNLEPEKRASVRQLVYTFLK